MTRADVFHDVATECERQDGLWGQQEHEPFTWLTILTEEVGEAAQASLKAHFGDKPWANYREEMIHAAAVIVQAVWAFDRKAGTTRAYDDVTTFDPSTGRD